jgi:hypothetical protein
MSADHVKIDGLKAPATGPLPIRAKLAHLLALIVSAVIALLVSDVLADGSSIIKLKSAAHLPRITNSDLVELGLDYRADELLGPSYGVGLHHDSSGYTWNQAGAEYTLSRYVDELGLAQVRLSNFHFSGYHSPHPEDELTAPICTKSACPSRPPAGHRRCAERHRN